MHHKHVIYPFTAIVGQDDMKLGLILNAIDPRIGGVLIRGEKGTAKSTAVRGLSDLLPEIEIVTGCPFNCDPDNLREMCRACQQAVEQGQALPRLHKKMTVVELPVSATEDRVVGSLDIQKALKEGIRALHAGVLAEANRNILYIDEVNLLDDHVANVLLDAAAMGVNIIEREGVSLHHPARFILVGTMNPEEGELRPQLLDRFGLCVQVKGLMNKEDRAEVVTRREEFDKGPWAFATEYEGAQADLRDRIIKAREQLKDALISEVKLDSVAEACANLGIETLRADIVVTKAAKALAALEGRIEVDDQDILKAMELALPHRLRKKPFEKVASKQEILEALGRMPEDTQQEPLTEKTFKVDTSLKLAELARSIEKDKVAPGRNYPPTNSPRGKYVSARPRGDSNDIALDATLRKAAANASEGRLEVNPEHLMEKIRLGKSGVLYIFCLDSSSSMGAQARMELAKGAVCWLLQTAYQRRDKVALIAFRGSEAELVLPPTASVETAQEKLKELPTGGKTPLSQGILECLKLIERQRDKSLSAQIVLISDGRGNLPIKGSLREDLIWLGEEIRGKGIRVVVINTGRRSHDLGHLKEFAEAASGQHFFLEEAAGW
ncbi:magnesium chelatase subunit D family protein [Chloroflexota bacterium]